MPNIFGGDVVRMRINPKDSMRIVDALTRMGIEPKVYRGALSFSQATKMVLESCLAALESQGLIPTRDGFEYSEMMAAFPRKEEARQLRHKQIQFTQIQSHPRHTTQPIVEDDFDKAKRRRRYNELIIKQGAAKESMDEAEWVELGDLIAEFQT